MVCPTRVIMLGMRINVKVFSRLPTLRVGVTIVVGLKSIRFNASRTDGADGPDAPGPHDRVANRNLAEHLAQRLEPLPSKVQ